MWYNILEFKFKGVIMKTILLLFLIISGSIISQESTGIRFKFASTFIGEYDNQILSKTYKSKNGMEFMLESFYRPNNMIEFASGIGYQEHGKLKEGGSKTFYSIPLYISFKYNILSSLLYTKFLGGFSFNKNKFENVNSTYKTNHGYYAGLGLGIEFWNIELEGIYSLNSISFHKKETIDDSIKYDNTKDIVYSRISLGISYKFDF